MKSSVWDNEMLYDIKNNGDALKDFNNAINALYSLDVGALTAKSLNTTTSTEAAVNRILGDSEEYFGNVAIKLCMVRCLLFGERLNWERLYEILEEEGRESK